MKRSRHIFGAGLVVIALGVAACGGGGGEKSGTGTGNGDEKVTIVYAGFGGALGEAEQKAYIEPFMAEHPNIKVVYDSGVNFAKLKAMRETNNPTWDVYTGNLLVTDPENYMEKLDCTIIPCDEIVKSNNVTPYLSIYYSYSQVVTYNTAKFKNDPPKTWADLFNPQKYPGKRATSSVDGARGLWEAAAAASGVAADKVYPLDMDRAEKEMVKIRKDLLYVKSNGDCPKLVDSGEATFGICVNGQISSAIKAGAKNIGVSWDTPKISYGAIGVVKGSKQAKAAQQLVGYILDKKNNAKLSKYIDYGPTNRNAFDQVDPAKKDQLPSAYQDKPHIEVDWVWFAQHGIELEERFLKFKQGG